MVESQSRGSALVFVKNRPFAVKKNTGEGERDGRPSGGWTLLEWVDEGARALGRRGMSDRGGMRRRTEHEQPREETG